jgi:hypothetical protein
LLCEFTSLTLLPCLAFLRQESPDSRIFLHSSPCPVHIFTAKKNNK